jgi:preprotein translocase SecE subunit
LEEKVAKEENVTRITASDDSPKKAKEVVKQSKTAKPAVAKTKKPKRTKPTVLGRIGGYFKGAWSELRLVRWPNRRATWSMTLAVILFSAAFGLVILLLDILFQYLFDFMIK